MIHTVVSKIFFFNEHYVLCYLWQNVLTLNHLSSGYYKETTLLLFISFISVCVEIVLFILFKDHGKQKIEKKKKTPTNIILVLRIQLSRIFLFGKRTPIVFTISIVMFHPSENKRVIILKKVNKTYWRRSR